MAKKRADRELRDLEKEFLTKAKGAFEQMFGSDGQNGLVTFGEREDAACRATDELARWLIENHLEADPAATPQVEADCPICGGPVTYGSAEQAQRELREFQTRRGKIEYRRAASRCPRCRRIFFPTGQASGGRG